MKTIFLIDWFGIFLPDGPVGDALLEIFVRGSITYWFILLYMRFLRRGTGQMSLTDILLITMVADAAQNGMSADYKSLLEGFALVSTLFLWDFVLDWLGFRSLLVQKLIAPDPVLLIKDGRLRRENMKKSLITEDDLIGMLREQGVDDVKMVKECYLESSGNISVVSK